MDKTKVMTYFVIKGDDIPLEIITETLGIEPTKAYKKGDEIVRPCNRNVVTTEKRYRLYTSWELGTKYVETLCADEQAKDVIKPLLNKVKELQEIQKKYNCSYILMQVPIVEEGCAPALGFDKTVIDFCSQVGAEIEIDLYVNPYVSGIEM
jgi:hypothetical protein